MKYKLQVTCGHPGCSESMRFEYDRVRDYLVGQKHHVDWQCIKHANPERVLSVDNRQTVVRMATKRGGSRSYFGTWGVISGPGYYADANDFPEGTIVEVTARVIFPTEGE